MKIEQKGIEVMPNPYIWQPSYLTPLQAALPRDLLRDFDAHPKAYDRFDRIFYALTGADPKSSILFFGLSPEPASIRYIINRVQKAQPDVWQLIDKVVRDSYFRKGFLPANIIQEVKVGGVLSYLTLPEGETLGKYAAESMLRSSAKLGRPISSLFNHSISCAQSGPRPYINRAAILLALSDSTSNEIELAKQLKLSTTLTRSNLMLLRAAGLIDFDYHTKLTPRGKVLLDLTILPILYACLEEPNHEIRPPAGKMPGRKNRLPNSPEAQSNPVTRHRKSLAEYQQDLQTRDFWEQLLQDVEKADTTLSFPEFLANYRRLGAAQQSPYDNRPYRGFVLALQSRDRMGGSNYLLDFIPTRLSLRIFVKYVQDKIREGFAIRPSRISPKDWLEKMSLSSFWEEFKVDLTVVDTNSTFSNFLAYYDAQNPDPSITKKKDGKKYLGKYYRILKAFYADTSVFLSVPELAGIASDAKTVDILRKFFYYRAPAEVKTLLLQKFPGDFTESAIREELAKAAQSSAGTNDELLSISNPRLLNGKTYLIDKVNRIAGLPLEERKAVLAYALYWKDPSKWTYHKLGELLGISHYKAEELIERVTYERPLINALNIVTGFRE